MSRVFLARGSPAVVDGGVGGAVSHFAILPAMFYFVADYIRRIRDAFLSMTIAENWMNLPPQLMCTKVNFIYDQNSSFCQQVRAE